MTRDEYRAEITRLKDECLEADIERAMLSMERVGLSRSRIRDGKRYWSVPEFTAEERARRLRLLEDLEDLEDLAGPIRERIAEVQIDYVMDWLRRDHDWWTVEQMAEECEIPAELAQMIVDSLPRANGGTFAPDDPDSPRRAGR